MKNLIKILVLASTMAWMNTGLANETQTNTASQQVVDVNFLYSVEGTYGWNPTEGDISYDFFRDGRLHIQGADGEASMWEGTWALSGNQLTLINSDLNTSETVTATRDGDDLLLNEKRYRRYRPGF